MRPFNNKNKFEVPPSKKIVITILISIFLTGALCGQNKPGVKKNNNDTNLVSFIVKFDKRQATKDGYYLGGYVVGINYKQSKRLNGKTIRITGKVSIERGLDPRSSKSNQDGSTAAVQGRSGDTKHIESPVIEIVKSKN
jgi:hypothetical protein